MHFTLVFRSNEATDRSYGMVFIPCPCWVRGSEVLINLNPHTPELEPGSVKRLIEREKLRPAENEGRAQCTIVAHPEGHGGYKEMGILRGELQDAGFGVCVVEG